MEPISTIQFEPRAPRRVVTAPAGVPLSSNRPLRDNSGTVETLYVHSDVKIISFSAGGDADPKDSEITGPLASSSSHERTIAVGLFRIYRAPGSVAFLNCGSALKPIMPKGQCWSVTNTNSIFVLQIRRPSYWRIELPDSTEEDLEKALELRAVFDSILQFEKTPCPFQRSFTVPLPEKPPEPTKKKQWAPVPQRLSVDYSKVVEVAALPAKLLDNKPRPTIKSQHLVERDSSSRLRINSTGGENTQRDSLEDQDNDDLQPELTKPARVVAESMHLRDPWTSRKHVARHHERPLDPIKSEPPHERDSITDMYKSISIQVHADRPAPTIAEHGTEVPHLGGTFEENRNHKITQQSSMEYVSTFDAIEGSGTVVGGMKAKLRRRRHTGFGTLRSAPSAPQLTLIASPPSKSTQQLLINKDEIKSDDEGRLSPTLSSDSFHSTQSWISPITSLPPSPPLLQSEEGRGTFPYPHDHITLPMDSHADPEVLPTPGTPDATPRLLSSYSSPDRTPTQLHPRQHRTAEVWQKADRDSGRLGVLNKEDLSDNATTLNQGLPTTSEQVVVRRRILSPLPAVVTMLHTPSESANSPKNSRGSLGSLPMLLVAKTCGLLLRPPGYLISLMLKVAARITAGEWRGTAMGYDPTGENIPVDWDYSDSEWEDSWRESAVDRELYKAQDTDDRLSLQEEEFEDANQGWEVD